jgi:hypothetical protein
VQEGLAAFGPLTRAESLLVAGIGTGAFDRVGAGGVPREGDADRRVRAELIRALLLNRPDMPRLHEKGMRLGGAWIAGTLDLEGCRLPRDLGLLDCRFDSPPVLLSAVIDTLSFDGSVLPGLSANRLEARGDILFRSATIDGPVLLRGAQISGDVVLDGATLSFPGEIVFAAPGLSVRGSFLARGARMNGALSLPGARINGQMDLVGLAVDRPEGVAIDADSVSVTGDVALRLAEIAGTVSLVTARIGGDLDLSGAQVSHPGDQALRLNRTVVEGAFFLREGAKVEGALNLSGAMLGAIVDDPASWPAQGDLLLNRCLYRAFLGSPVDAGLRLDWLALQAPERWREDFWPQPYEHLGQVLREMGHDEDARRVLIQKERLARQARRARAKSRPARVWQWLIDTFVGLTTGYGRVPLRALVLLAVLWAVGAGVFLFTEAEDAMRPNVVVVLRSPEWVLCGVPQGEAVFLPSLGQMREGLALPGQPQVRCFLDRPEAASFPKFNPFMLSLDALLPGVETGQSAYWSPDTRVPVGLAAKRFAYFLTVAGWALSLLAVAGFSGIVKTS